MHKVVSIYLNISLIDVSFFLFLVVMIAFNVGRYRKNCHLS